MTDEQVNLTDFLAQTLNQQYVDYDRLDVQTDYVNNESRKQQVQKVASKNLKNDMDQFNTLQKVQNLSGHVISFKKHHQTQKQKKKQLAHTIMDDQIDQIMMRAELIDQEQVQKPQKRYTLFQMSEDNEQQEPSESSSSDPLKGININEILVNQEQIKQQNIRILQLKAKLLTNKTKLQRWAKIKSRKFRKIHNKEQREKKLLQLQQKLKDINTVGQLCDIDDYCQEIVNEQLNQGTIMNETEHQMGLLEKQGEVPVQEENCGLFGLKFMYDVIKNQEQQVNDIINEQENKRQINQVQKYTDIVQQAQQYDRYDDNPFLIPNENEAIPTEMKPSKTLKALNKVKEMFMNEYEQKEDQTVRDLQEDEIDGYKNAEVNRLLGPEEEVLQGWGSWMGEGITEQQKEQLTFKQQILKQQRINQQLDEKEKRLDAGNSMVYINQSQLDPELMRKYSGHNLGRVSQEEYEKYLRQAILPQYSSVSNNRYITQDNVQIQRGIVIHQNKSMENNVRELEKIQKQFEEQSVYIKGKAMDTQKRKSVF